MSLLEITEEDRVLMLIGRRELVEEGTTPEELAEWNAYWDSERSCYVVPLSMTATEARALIRRRRWSPIPLTPKNERMIKRVGLGEP